MILLKSLLFGSLPLIVTIILRIILDLRLAPWLIIILSKIRTRGLFRDSPPIIAGEWEQIWNSDSQNFAKDTDRHSNATIYQFGRYCYAEFFAKGNSYCLFGQVRDNFVFGEWYPKKAKIGYFGAFKIRIISDNEMSGIWLGHSQRSVAINTGEWSWIKNQ